MGFRVFVWGAEATSIHTMLEVPELPFLEATTSSVECKIAPSRLPLHIMT